MHSYDGGWADLVQAREEKTAAPPVVERSPKEPTTRRPIAKKKGPTELEQVERRITELEQQVAQLEAKLAEDWSNPHMLTAYSTARDELQELLARWEALFESV